MTRSRSPGQAKFRDACGPIRWTRTAQKAWLAQQQMVMTMVRLLKDAQFWSNLLLPCTSRQQKLQLQSPPPLEVHAP